MSTIITIIIVIALVLGVLGTIASAFDPPPAPRQFSRHGRDDYDDNEDEEEDESWRPGFTSISFTYIDGDGNLTHRVLDVWAVNSEYVEGWRQRYQAKRTFRLDPILFI
jgi:hypothetical protein